MAQLARNASCPAVNRSARRSESCETAAVVPCSLFVWQESAKAASPPASIAETVHRMNPRTRIVVSTSSSRLDRSGIVSATDLGRWPRREVHRRRAQLVHGAGSLGRPAALTASPRDVSLGPVPGEGSSRAMRRSGGLMPDLLT
jgi:hypothetical protein